MGVPRLAYYTIEELAELWEMSVDKIEKYTERGQLHNDSIWYNSHEDEDFEFPGDKHPEGPDENDHSRTWFHKCNIYPLEEVKRFEKEHGIVPTPHAQVDPPRLLAKVKRKNPLLNIIINTYDHLASSQNKNPTWKECYKYLMNKDSRKLVDKENYIITINDNGIFTSEPKQNKQFIAKESFKKRFERLEEKINN